MRFARDPLTRNGVERAADPGVQALLGFVEQRSGNGINSTDPLVLRLKKRLVPSRLRFPLRLMLTAVVRRRSLRKARELRSRSPLLLNIASGYGPKPGWVNIDLFGAPTDLDWDITRSVPFPDGSVDAIYHEHLLEHLSLEEALELCRECHRVLRPGGVLRIGVPDAGALLGSYAGTAGREWAESAPSPMLAVDILFYDTGHRFMYDGELLTLLLGAAGFPSPRRSEFGRSQLEPAPDDPDRRDGTLFVEATK
jgi:SAM-dependent methyltransferase